MAVGSAPYRRSRFRMLAACGPMLLAGAVFLGPAVCRAATEEVNVYSSRHYDTDVRLYAMFTAKTGIVVNLIDGKDDELIERIRNEGINSPADVLVTVDAGRLWRAQEAGLLQPVRSAVLESAIPPHLREPEGYWFGLTKRARILVYNKATVKPEQLSSYEALAAPIWKGRVLARSSRNVYNQSLVGALLRELGTERTEAWAAGVAANFARKPQGGDLDQIQAVAAGIGDVALSNTYYLGRLAASAKPEDQALAARVGIFFPNQDDRGTHVNISGAGVVKTAPRPGNAVAFLEYLVSPDAQKIFAEGNFEYPVVAGVAEHPVIAAWGAFKEHTLNASLYGRANADALTLMERAGWK